MMQEHDLAVQRTARVVTLGPLNADVRATWFVLHGQGQLATRFARRFAALDTGDRLVVAPEGLSRYYAEPVRGIVGASWMTKEERLKEIDDYVRYLDQVAAWLPGPARDAPRTVVGFSQGSATAWRWVTDGAARPPARLVIWGGEVPPDLDLARAADRLRDAEILLVAGTDDPWCTPAKLTAYVARLAQAGMTAATRTFPGGHDIHLATLEAVAG